MLWAQGMFKVVWQIVFACLAMLQLMFTTEHESLLKSLNIYKQQMVLQAFSEELLVASDVSKNVIGEAANHLPRGYHPRGDSLHFAAWGVFCGAGIMTMVVITL